MDEQMESDVSGWIPAVEASDLGLKRLAQRRPRQVLLLLDEDDPAELGQAFELIGAAESALDQLLQRAEDSDG